MAKAIKFFHVGGYALSNIDWEGKNIKYTHLFEVENVFQELIQIKAIPLDEKNNSKNIFLFGGNSISMLSEEQLTDLPSYQVFYEDPITNLPESKMRILDLKGARRVNLNDGGTTFAKFLSDNYGVGMWGTSIDNDTMEFSTSFSGSITKKGSAKTILEGSFGNNFTQIIVWNNELMTAGKTQFHAEIKSINKISGQITTVSNAPEYFFRLYYSNDGILKTWDVSTADLLSGHAIRNTGYVDFPVRIALFVKGKGRIEVGDIHIRSALFDDNFLAIGGRRLVDEDSQEELGYYFNAGDLKPPLNIYFSGFRPAEGYEGRWMMGRLGSPFILVHDPRIVGGSFYRGAGLEAQLTKVIEDTLRELNFSKADLVLSGLSMGTYAAFYYASLLNPHAIVVGKPLANIGYLAVNSRISSPYDWELAMDTIIQLTGELTEESSKRLDNEFWKKFLSTDFSDTTFVIAHMLQDTDRPFERIFNHLKENYPSAKILHKGLEGRHNDDTNGIIKWFFKQYKSLLKADFDKQVTDDDFSPDLLEMTNE